MQTLEQIAEQIVGRFLQVTGRETFPLYGSHYRLLLDEITAALREAEASALREAVERVDEMHETDGMVAVGEIRDWLNARADRLSAGTSPAPPKEQ